jgi:hypothetical protein
MRHLVKRRAQQHQYDDKNSGNEKIVRKPSSERVFDTLIVDRREGKGAQVAILLFEQNKRATNTLAISTFSKLKKSE